MHLLDHYPPISILSSPSIKKIEWQLTLIFQHFQELISPLLLANNLCQFLKPNPNLLFTDCLPISRRRIILLITPLISLPIILLSSLNYNRIASIKADTIIHRILIKSSRIIQITEALLLQPSTTIFDLLNQSTMKSLRPILPMSQNLMKISLLSLPIPSTPNSPKPLKSWIIVSFRSSLNTCRSISN